MKLGGNYQDFLKWGVLGNSLIIIEFDGFFPKFKI